jgi:TRAP-type mannitol/chloroaromatic compound transport system permease small subunit
MRFLKRLAELIHRFNDEVGKPMSALIDGLNDKIGAAIRWLALMMVLVGAGTALLRYYARGLELSLNLTPPTELQWYLFSLIFLLGAAYGLNHNVHVRVDVLYERLSKRSRAFIDLVGTIIFLIPFSLVMLYVSWPAVSNSISIREASPDPGGLPRWPIKILIIVSFVLLTLQGLSHIVKQIDILRGKGDGSTTPEEGTAEPAPAPEASA